MMKETKAGVTPGQYLTFHLGTDEYALGILQVREIIGLDRVTRVPGVPAWIRGVINLRGHVVPVIDLALKFGLPRGDIDRRPGIVIADSALEGEQTVVGILVDGVGQVMDFLAEDLEPAPSFGTRIRPDFLRGLGKADRRLIPILDVDCLLTADELLAAESARDGAGPAAGGRDAAGAADPPGAGVP
jgi:purine-binding chemotaxis protein CheW